MFPKMPQRLFGGVKNIYSRPKQKFLAMPTIFLQKNEEAI
jgi:hypothetical protein